MAVRFGIDTGGTFTDLAVLDDKGQFRMYKAQTTPHDYSQGILDCIRQCAADYGLELDDFIRREDPLLVHGCTIATNAVIQWKGAKTGIICTRGHRSTLWKREGNKIDVFNFNIPWPKPLVPVYLCLEVDERINSEGEVMVPLNEDSVRAAIRQLKQWNVEAIGVCLIWSIVNNAHEKRVGEIIEEEWPGVPYSLSSEVQPIIREWHRTSCVAFDAMLKPVMSKYVDTVSRTLARHGFGKEFLMVGSSGGIMTARETMSKPVYTLFSGPAMGPSAGLFFARHEGIDNCVTIDMGGTSFDVGAVIDGIPTVTREAMVGPYPTGVTSIDVLTLGAGGGSIAWVDKGGLLRVGPESAGAEPGPASYGKGGQRPTVTDANIVLGYLDPNYFLGGRMRLHPELAYRAIEEHVAIPLKQDTRVAASGIHRVVNENMVGGILDMTLRKGIDPREFVLVCGGGATALHAARLARELDIKKVIVPKAAPVLCAMGMLNADIVLSFVASKYTTTKSFDYEGVNSALAQLEKKAGETLDKEGIPPQQRRYEYYVAARYVQQPYAIDIPLRVSRLTPDNIGQFIEDFHSIHERRYGSRDPDSHIECTDWRVLGIGVMPKINLKEQPPVGEDASGALRDSRDAYFEEAGEFIKTPVYDGERLVHGMRLNGPAIIDDLMTTTVVIPGSCVTVNRYGSYIMELS